MATTTIRPKDRAEWLKYRESGIGSSEVATILGLNPYETAYQLWRRKKGLDPAKTETFAMKAGHYLEDAVAHFWSDATGKEIIKRSAVDWIIANQEKSFLQVSPDRTYWLGDSRSPKDKGILECKTTQMSIDENDIPKYWFCQVQYQLGTAELEQGSIAWLSQGRQFGYQDLKLVPDFYAWQVEEVEKFWADCILGNKEPEATSVADIMLKYNRHTDGKVMDLLKIAEAEAAEATTEEERELAMERADNILNACKNLKKVKEEIAKLDESKEELENIIKMSFKDAEAISYGGDLLATWKAPKPSLKFDEKAFKSVHPELVTEFSKPYQGARRFLLK